MAEIRPALPPGRRRREILRQHRAKGCFTFCEAAFFAPSGGRDAQRSAAVFDSLTGNVKSTAMFFTRTLPEDDSGAKQQHKALPAFCAGMVAAGWAARYNKDVPRETTGNKKKENIFRPERRADPSEGDIYYEKDHSSFVPVHLRRCCRCCCPDCLRRCSFFCRCFFRSRFQHCGVCCFRRCPVRQCGHRRFYLYEERHCGSDRGLRRD